MLLYFENSYSNVWNNYVIIICSSSKKLLPPSIYFGSGVYFIHSAVLPGVYRSSFYAVKCSTLSKQASNQYTLIEYSYIAFVFDSMSSLNFL